MGNGQGLSIRSGVCQQEDNNPHGCSSQDGRALRHASAHLGSKTKGMPKMLIPGPAGGGTKQELQQLRLQ